MSPRKEDYSRRQTRVKTTAWKSARASREEAVIPVNEDTRTGVNARSMGEVLMRAIRAAQPAQSS